MSNFKIIAVHAEYDKGKLSILAVVWESNPDGFVRASYCTPKPVSGYKYLSKKDDDINNDLIQQVAGKGMCLPDNLIKKFFAGNKYNWEN